MKKEKILIVEDEPIVALEIQTALSKFGYSVTDSVSNFEDAIASVKENEPNIVFMDINLESSKDGIDTAKEIKKINTHIQIIYLTAFTDDETMQRAIATNPSNYLVKPFKREELKSSVLLSVYKIKNRNDKDVKYEYTALGYDYYFDVANDNLFYKREPIKLGVKEKLFLKLLIEADGNVVPFSTFESHIWPNASVTDGAFRTLVYRLRPKLENKLIKSVPSFGYKLR